MEYVKLKTRPRSTHTVTNFGGLWHNEEAPAGGLSLSNKARHYWYDEKGLSSDGSPAMQTERCSDQTAYIDNNEISNPIIAMCPGEHPIILDDTETVYCNGHHVGLPFYQDVVIKRATGRFAKGEVTILTDQSGVDTVAALENVTPTGFRTWTFRNVDAENDIWMIGGVGYQEDTLETTFGITIQGAVPDTVGDTITIVVRPDYPYASWSYGQPRSIVRMGAWAVIFPENVAVNAVKLAAGTATSSDVVGLSSYWQSITGAVITITPCRADGTSLTGSLTVSATEPAVQSGIWVDVSGETTVYREWSATTYSWVVIPEPFVKIECPVDHPTQADVSHDTDLKQWDGVVMTAGDGVILSNIHAFSGDTSLDGRLQSEVRAMLNSSYVLYDVSYNNGTYLMTMLVPGVLTADHFLSIPTTNKADFVVERKTPKMDYVVECGNRLWGCYYGPNDDGEILNEIYASVLGDYTNWSVYRGLSTDSWTASRGVAAPFTGAAVLHNSPLFFREESVEKVYPSSSGAHQIQTFDIEGVEQGSWRSLVVIDDRLYYKSKLGVCVYSGTMPVRISDAFGDMRFTNGTATKHKRKYLLSQIPEGGAKPYVYVYDTTSGDWHVMGEDDGWTGTAVSCNDTVYYTNEETGLLYDLYGDHRTEWYAETGIIGYELPEHRFISCVRIRFRMPEDSDSRFLKVYIQYDDSGTWQQKANFTARPTLDSGEINIFPRRCDHFRLRLSGHNQCKIVSISYRMERSEGGH